MLSSLFHSLTARPALLSRLVFVMFAISTLGAYLYARQYEHARIANAFNELAALKTQRVLLRVDGYERTLLDLRGLFVADPDVTDHEFDRFLRGVEVLQRYPALLCIGHAPGVTERNRARMEDRIERMGLSDYEASPGDFPIVYAYPNRDTLLGTSLSTSKFPNPMLDRARDINQPQLSAQLPLRFDRKHRPGFVIYVPLYGSDIPPRAVEQRRLALSGYLFAAFLTEELIFSTIGDDLGTQMGLSVFDGPTPDGARLAYTSGHGFQAHGVAGSGSYTSVQPAGVSGREWTFLFVALPAFVQENQSALPLVVLVGGLITSGLAAGLAYVTSRRWLAESKIRYLAYHDELTGLANRACLRICIQAAIRHEQQTQRPCALVIVQLMRVRDINYTLGHLIGDEVLKQAAMRIREAAGQEATTARIRNVQFGVLLPDADLDDAVDAARRLVAALEEPLPACDSKYEVGARAGIALAPADTSDPDELVRHADIALNMARTSGSEYVVYDPAADPYQPQRLALLGAFRQAIKDEQLELYCQPKADLRTGQITGVEALARWQHPEYGLLMPDQFISLIEPTELIQLLTRRMLESALRQCHEWRQSRLFLPVAVNLSTRNLLNPALPDLIGRLMKDWDADSSWVQLEITESSMMDDPALSLRVLNRLRAMGFMLFVDDFGIGYSSLSYLMKMPVSVLKIDQSFTMNMVSDPHAAMIVKTIIELAHNMGMKVVAEGVASKEIWDALKRLNCDEAQGYYISPPLPADAILSWLERSPWQRERA